jgi:hydrogenase maturation protease
VIGVGNAWRGDDAAGLLVAERVREAAPGLDVRDCEGEPIVLLDAWEGADAVWVVDAVSSGAPPGTIHRLDVDAEPLPATLFRPSTHTFGVAEAVELARALDRLPERLVVFGIEGDTFEAGDGVSEAVAAAAVRVARTVRTEVEACTSRR